MNREEFYMSETKDYSTEDCSREAGFSAQFYVLSEQRPLNKAGMHFSEVSKKTRPARTQRVSMGLAPGKGVISKELPELVSQEGRHFIFILNMDILCVWSMRPFLE